MTRSTSEASPKSAASSDSGIDVSIDLGFKGRGRAAARLARRPHAGSGTHGVPLGGPTFVDATLRGRKISRGARLWSVATATLKSETYRSLQLDRPTDEELADGLAFPAGFVHLPRAVEPE